MNTSSYWSLGFVALTALGSVGCASGPAAPFDTMKSSNLTAFRLQNYEQQQPAAAAPGQQPGAFGLPPEIQNFIQAGAQGLQQLLPGVTLPGMPGPATPAPPPANAQVPRFHNFRILGQTQVIDADLKEDLADILGDGDNFESKPGCMYAEMGLSFSNGGPPNDVLISFSCNQIQSQGFAWPHSGSSPKPSTVKKLAEVVQKLWPPGT